jgi:hypothetical protein
MLTGIILKCITSFAHDLHLNFIDGLPNKLLDVRKHTKNHKLWINSEETHRKYYAGLGSLQQGKNRYTE